MDELFRWTSDSVLARVQANEMVRKAQVLSYLFPCSYDLINANLRLACHPRNADEASRHGLSIFVTADSGVSDRRELVLLDLRHHR